MKLTLFTRTIFDVMTLPQKHAGQYWLCSRNSSGKAHRVLAVEGVRPAKGESTGRWELRSNTRYQIVSQDGAPLSRVPLELLSMYTIRSVDGHCEYRLFTEPLSSDRKHYQAYEILPGAEPLEIGRSDGCDIHYACPYVGKHHAALLFSGSNIRVIDNNSLNRTFVNGRAVQQVVTKPGDVLYIMGMQIVLTRRYLFINNPDGKVKIQSRWLRVHHAHVGLAAPPTEEDTPESAEFDDYYYRQPRFKRDVEPFKLTLDAPPNSQINDETPMIMALGPSVTMGMASATTAAFAVVNAANTGNVTSAIPSIVMSFGMLSGTLLWPTITKNYQKKLKIKKENARQTTYSAYLQQMDQKITQEIGRQEQILRENDSTAADYYARVTGKPLQIWERTPKHSDFLRLRLGCGRLPLNADIQYPQRHFAVEQDNLMEAMYQFGETERWLQDVPICLPLTEHFISGVYGSPGQLLRYAKSLILQLTVLHSYDEVKLVLLYDESQESLLSFSRFLPHCMDNEQRIRYIATNPEEAKNLSTDLEPVIDRRKQMNGEDLEDEESYYVVLCLDKKLAAKAEFIRSLLESKENIRFSVISLYERLKDLPKECTAVIGLDEGAGGTLTLLNGVSGMPIPFQVDDLSGLNMDVVSGVLSNTLLNVTDSAFQLPKKYTFLEMLDIGMVEHLNLLENWSSNNPTKSLAAPIGIDPSGELFYLDLHEKAHGPHGLVAGMTGSGKSETIISYILAMALNYHPNEVAFILIDYKGGGMAKAFENLPHTAGIITNLDGNAINRSLVSLQSELHRRELIFQQVSAQHHVSNIDIYKYQKLYREGKVSKALPHLIIISDEFAELKKDQPEFMTALTSAARVGRSLGVHLILATQKPGGVVDDQIRSNSRFRLCLKVQDRGDSSEMLGRPEAASLVETGRFYLQVGNNELFKLGQSAWAGAPYYCSPKTIKERDDGISVINTNGRVIAEANIDRFAGRKDAPKQLDAITAYIRKVSREEQIPSWKMWMDPIADNIFVEDLAKKYPSASGSPFTLAPIVGEYDDPAHQSQNVFRVPLTQEGNTIIYGSAGSGKSMFLETMCYWLISRHSPDQVNLYIMDFGSETMTAFSGAPHVGDVILSREQEKVANLFKLLHGELNIRKKLIAQFGGALEQYNSQASYPLANIVVIVNNYANFTELYENHLGDISFLTREGTRYGIYFVLSCTGINNVRLNLLQNFKCIYCLQMNNPNDYASVVGKTNGLVLGKAKGRGMIRLDKQVLEFQTAQVKAEAPHAFFRSFCAELADKFVGKQARNVPILPEAVTIPYLSRHIRPGSLSAVPVGVEKETLEIARVDFAAHPVHIVLAQSQEWDSFVNGLAAMVCGPCGINTILLAPGGCADTLAGGGKLTVCTNRNSCVQAVCDIFSEVRHRNNTYKTELEEGRSAPTFEPLFVVIKSISQLKSLLEGYVSETPEAADDTPMNRLQLAMEKCAAAYRVCFVVAENIQTIAPFTSGKWYKTQITGSSGIWIGNGISSQYRLTVNKKPQGFSGELDHHFGFLVKNATAALVKFLQHQEAD